MGIEGVPCAKHSELCDEIERGVAAIILSEPATASYTQSRLTAVLAGQPTWSVIPTIIIVTESTSSEAVSNKIPLGATFIERPVHIKTLTSIIQIALHARRNQYAVRDLLRQRETLVDILRHEATMKNEFLATLAHELRNPLAPIRTGLQILRLSPPGTPSLETIEMMDRQVTHLVRLIDDLLDISRISRGKLELRKQRVELSVLLSSAVEASKPCIDTGQHTLTISAPAESVWLDGDPVRLSQIISNLLNNAAKYTPKGGVITLTACLKDDTIQIAVKDNGIGLSPQMLTKVFDMFSQVEPSLARSQGGLGIGLTLARRLAEMHDGAVEASSEGEGKGCTFTVILPFKKDIQAYTPERWAEDDVKRAFRGRSHRVLIVDDQVDIAQSLKDLLSLLGQDTHTVHNGPEALQAARDFKPELIFLDIGLPGMNGYEVVRSLREQKGDLKPTIIAVTGWGDERSITLAREAGFDRHLTKPVDPREIDGILETLECASKQ
jgi:signal transduction histidine kinase/ActR/RegA family two-component response regulator